jgi:hypothetical protein
LPRKEYQNPPLAFEAREGMGVAVVTHKRMQNPPLMFEAREGMVVAIVTYKRTQDPPTHVCSEGGGDGGCHHSETNARTPHSHLK